MTEPTRARKIRNWIEHWLLLLVSPLVVSLLASAVVAAGTGMKISSLLWVLLGVALLVWIVAYLAAYKDVFHTPIVRWAQARRRRRFAKPRVMILDGRIDDAGKASVPRIFTTRPADDWFQELKRQNPNWRVELASVDHSLSNAPDIIVNPFGEAYPEEDLSLHTTFTRLRDYVRGGGVFVNVAGYPFWWKANPATGTKAEAGRWEQQPPNLMVLKSLLPDMLGISPVIPGSPQLMTTKQEPRDFQRFGEIAGAGGGNDAVVFRHYPISTERMIPLLRTGDGQGIVIGAVPFGAGHFVFAGLEIDEQSRSFAKAVAAIRGWARYECQGEE